MSEYFPYLHEHQSIRFPNVEKASPEGIVAVGGNLSPGVLLSAYRQGIFPWFSEDDPLLWWSPDPRFVLFPEKMHVSKSMGKYFRIESLKITMDGNFPAVIDNCRKAYRRGQAGTWITEDMREAYCVLHKLGYAHSVEVKQDGELCGGLYGVSLGRCFFGESMYSLKPNTSKAALAALAWYLGEKGFKVIDCQVYTKHLAGLGAELISRSSFIDILLENVKYETFKGNWGEIFPDFPLSESFMRIKKIN